MTNQDYVNQAIAAGIPSGAISNFLSGNPGDYSRIMSALGPDYIQGSGGSVTSYAPAAPYATQPAPYATPTVGSALTTVSPSDGVATGVLSSRDVSGPLSITVQDRTSGSAPASMTVLPAAGIPPWAMLIAFGVLAFLFLRK